MILLFSKVGRGAIGLYARLPFLLFFSLLLLLPACREDGATAKHALEYWSSNNGGEIQFSRWVVDRWNTEHPDQPVKAQPIPEGQSSEEIILAAVVGETTPDIYSNIWQGTVAFYSQADILVALDTLDGFMPFLRSRCSTETIREITAENGHIYQFPWKINPIMTIYNQQIFADLGLHTPPQTYGDYLAAARQFKADTDGDGYVDQWFGNTSVKLAWYQRLFNFYPLYLAASGGAPLIQNNKAVFNNEHAVGVFRFLQTLYQENYFSRDQQSAGQDLFIAERVATKFTGPWEIQYLESYKREGFEYSFYPMPVPDGHRGPNYTYCDPKSIVIFNRCKNPQLAFEFIKQMVDETGDLQFLETTYQLPRRAGLDTLPGFRDFFAEHPRMRTFAEQAEHIRGVDNCEVLTEVFDIISQEYEACVLYSVKSPEQAIADAERAVNVLLRAEK